MFKFKRHTHSHPKKFHLHRMFFGIGATFLSNYIAFVDLRVIFFSMLSFYECVLGAVNPSILEKL